MVSVVKPNWIFRLLCFWKSCFCNELHMTPEWQCRDINLWPIFWVHHNVSTLYPEGQSQQKDGTWVRFSGDRKINLPLLQPRCDSLVMRTLACAYSSFLQAQKHDSRRTGVVVDCSDETKLIRISTKDLQWCDKVLMMTMMVFLSRWLEINHESR
jgi:hypothetical protein